MPTITATDLNNAKLDTDHIAAYATSTAATATDRLGNVKNTIAGNNAAEVTARTARDNAEATAKATRESTEAAALLKRGYEVPVTYASGISLTRASQTVSTAGIVYAPNLADLPFTTSGTFEAAKFRIIQGVTAVDLAATGGAGLVGFTQKGTAAVLRTALSKMRDGVHISDFGGIADGVTDTVSALDAAILATSSAVYVNGCKNGTRIDFDLGDYYFSQAINLKHIVHLCGKESGLPGGNGTRFLFPAGSNGIIVNRYNTNGPTGTNGVIGGADGATIERIQVFQKGYFQRFASILDINTTTNSFIASFESSSKFAAGDSINVPTTAMDRAATVGVVGSVVITTQTLGFALIPGNFSLGETITGGTSGATGTVAYIAKQAAAVAVTGGAGTFTVGETVTGGTSAATGVPNIVKALPFPVYTMSSWSGIGWVVGAVALRAVDVGTGIILRARALIKNCVTVSWPEDGVRITADSGVTAGNANNSVIDVLYTTNTGRHGLCTTGGDANAGGFSRIDASGNGGWGIYDASFLGNHYFSCHTSINATGAYFSSGVNNFSVLLGCYSEGLSQLQPFRVPTSQMGGMTTVIGGDHGAGFSDTDTGLDQINASRGFGGFIGGTRLDVGTGMQYVGGSGQNNGSLSINGNGSTPDVIITRLNGGREGGYGPRHAWRLPYGGPNAPQKSDYSDTLMGGNIGIQWEDYQGSGFNVQLMPKKIGGDTDGFTVSGGGATRNAVLWPTIVGGIITAVTIVDNGAGYTSAPTIVGRGLWVGVVINSKVFNGQLREVNVVSSPSGLTNTGLVKSLNLTSLYLNPGVSAVQSLGTFTSRWSQLWLSGGIGCFGVTPPATRPSVNAASSDLASVIALCNQLRAVLVANGIAA